MKKMKRLVAVLLAGVMVLAMLTACGGIGNDAATAKFEAKVEQAYMAKLNEKLKATYGEKFENFENDETIKNLAVERIVAMADKETLTYKELWTKDETTQDWVMICYDSNQIINGTYVMSSYEAATAGTITPAQKDIDAYWSLVQVKAGNKKITALGVGAKTIGGKTYVAIGFGIKAAQ